MGGQRPPTRSQKWAARHPVATGLCAAVPTTLFFLALSPGTAPGDLAFAAFSGLALGLVFSLTAASERLRQRRLKRLGLWNGS
ncbi:hypothetical protein [Streptomyces sp. NRRL F-5123]|uniref:hypothetical protein n=1 Tax=Streptomyces sp. NRRL F-5123 TaxID=1463856 RepID=UPI000AF6A664|nr:hypothetical protein [Streptomyces sp. NRRL F-5123]